MKYISILLLALTFCCTSTTIPVEEKITFSSQGNQLVGYLSKPTSVKKFPVVVVLHSASHGHHDNDLYNHLEKNLQEIGIGVFTYDRRGSGESEGDFQSASLEDLAKDALAAIAILKKRNDVAVDKIGLYGISQGGWIAPIAYTLQPEAIQFMVLSSSCGTSPAGQMEYSAVTTLKMNGYDENIIKKAVELRNICNEYYRGNADRTESQNIINEYREEAWFSDVYLPWQGNLPKDVKNTKWFFEMDFDPMPYFKKVKIPLLLFYGDYDRWVPIDKSIENWKAAMKTAKNTNIEVYRIKNAGHMMILDEDSEPENPIISEEYNQILRTWLSEK